MIFIVTVMVIVVAVVKLVVQGDGHVICFLPQFVLFSKTCQLQAICLETELRRLQAEQERTSREEKEKKATLVAKKEEQFERKTEAMVPEREYRAVLQVSQ